MKKRFNINTCQLEIKQQIYESNKLQKTVDRNKIR